MDDRELRDLIGYYRGQGAPQDQQMLIALLREAQAAEGGLLGQALLGGIAQALGVKASLLLALVRRVPDLRLDTAPNRLDVCGGCRAGAALRAAIERTYGVVSGAESAQAGFCYRVTPCMKNCANGPSIRWNGMLFGGADEALVRRLISGEPPAGGKKT